MIVSPPHLTLFLYTTLFRSLPAGPASAHLEQTGAPDATPAQGPRGAGDLAAGADAVQAPADGRRVPHRLAQPPRAVTAVTRFGRPVEQAGHGPAPGGSAQGPVSCGAPGRSGGRCPEPGRGRSAPATD